MVAVVQVAMSILKAPCQVEQTQRSSGWPGFQKLELQGLCSPLSRWSDTSSLAIEGQQRSGSCGGRKNLRSQTELSLVALGPPLLVLDEASYWRPKYHQVMGKGCPHTCQDSPRPVLTDKCHLDCLPLFWKWAGTSLMVNPQPYLHLHFTHGTGTGLKSPDAQFLLSWCSLHSLCGALLCSQLWQVGVERWQIVYLKDRHLIRVMGRLNSHLRNPRWFILAPKTKIPVL